MTNTLRKERQLAENGTATVRATYNLGPIERVPLGEGRTFRAGNTLVTIFRARDGHVYATQPECPHRGGPLADGLVGSGKVICPLHNFAFDLATGQPIENTCAQLRTYPVSLNEVGDILLVLDS